jgi:anti-sigma factor RsiW
MNQHLTDSRANDYLDGALPPAEQADVQAHVADCVQCRDELDALRQLLAEVQSLPRGIRPERDLLPSIHQAIDRERVIPIAGWRSRTLWSMRWAVATAAMLLIVATAVITQAVAKKYRVTDSAATPPVSGSAVLVTREVDKLETEYRDAIAELQQLIEAQRTQLSPVTLRLLEQNLQIIDRAIQESRAALQEDPANDIINEMLWSAYEKKLELLRRATATST